ncbi:MAG: threonine/serine dehydratase [Thermomicrobiales bacterium]
MAAVEFADVLEARERIGDRVNRTPMLASDSLSLRTGVRLSIKAESLQRTGAFKVRGALNAVSLLTDDQRRRGVVTFSAGNHGAGLAYAAYQLGAACTVFMAKGAVASKVEAIRGFGADVSMHPTIQDAFAAMEATVAESGVVFVSPFGDPAIVAGQGTVGLEILEDFPEVEQIIVPIGGGGLISGIATVMAERKPEVRIIGVEPEGAPTMTLALEAGRPVRLETVATMADGLAAPFTSELNLDIVQRLVDDVVLVTEDEIASAVRLAAQQTKLVVEPASAAGLAALTTGKSAVPTGAPTVIIFTGGNIDFSLLKSLI